MPSPTRTASSSQPRRRRNPRQRDQQISDDAYGGHRHAMKDCVRTMVHDTAVPLVIDAARLGTGVVVDFQRQPGNHHSGKGEQNDHVAHKISCLVIVTCEGPAKTWPSREADQLPSQPLCDVVQSICLCAGFTPVCCSLCCAWVSACPSCKRSPAAYRRVAAATASTIARCPRTGTVSGTSRPTARTGISACSFRPRQL